jgi:hypothetical protein
VTGGIPAFILVKIKENGQLVFAHKGITSLIPSAKNPEIQNTSICIIIEVARISGGFKKNLRYVRL